MQRLLEAEQGSVGVALLPKLRGIAWDGGRNIIHMQISIVMEEGGEGGSHTAALRSQGVSAEIMALLFVLLNASVCG